ncbi:MAG: hypothetical protein KKF79_00005 [Gammaproteobacteria bacterium]|nr:hypothetical protein [Gammaproteobacteria bacterium]MBU2428657.1 hypothetical protein [Gammaproteobacteria bacterium]
MMNNPQPKQLLAQTHRVFQIELQLKSPVTQGDLQNQNQNQNRQDKTAHSQLISQAKSPMNAQTTANTTAWQRVVQRLKKIILPSLFAVSTLLVPQTQASDVSISVQGQIQPGVYGQLQVGQPAVTVYQQPVYTQRVYAQPVYTKQVYAQPVYQERRVIVQPILVQASKKHRKHWKKYCHHYGACQQPVTFVEVDYRPRTQYEKVYVYNDRQSGGREEKRHYHHDRR